MYYNAAFREFRLFRGSRDTALEIVRADYPFTITEQVSRRPVHDGYLTLLRLDPADTGPPAREQLDAFFARERAIDAEDHLRACYDRDDPTLADHELFQLMDFPMFDTGTALVAFGVAANHRYRGVCWLWSRIAFAHK